MRPFAMIIPVIALVAWIQLLPAPSAAQGSYVEVAFRCPGGNGILSYDWRNSLGAEYTEAGTRHDVKFRYSGSTGVTPIFQTAVAKRNGDSIRCDYNAANPASTLSASYSYEVHRTIISCASDGVNLVCKLKP